MISRAFLSAEYIQTHSPPTPPLLSSRSSPAIDIKLSRPQCATRLPQRIHSPAAPVISCEKAKFVSRHTWYLICMMISALSRLRVMFSIIKRRSKKAKSKTKIQKSNDPHQHLTDRLESRVQATRNGGVMPTRNRIPKPEPQNVFGSSQMLC